MKYNQRFNEQRALRFRQFTRKGWALFACLGRVVTISVLSVATLESASAATTDITTKRPHPASPAGEELTDVATAEDDLIEKVDSLAGIEVTGSLAPLTTGQGVRVVTVLTRDEIQAAPVQSVNDLLKLTAGVDVRQRGPLGAQTDVSIRGGTQEQVAVLLNGINICDPQTGHNTMDLPCNVADIVRIEVLEGPAGRVYGTQSLMGAINIVTSLPTAAAQGQQDHVQLALEGGSFGYLSAAASISHISALAPSAHQGNHISHFSSLTSHLSTSYTRSDGYSRSKGGQLNSDYSGVKAFYQGSSQAGDVRLNWHAGISDRGWGSNTFYSAKFDEQYEKTTKLYTALQGETTGRLHLKPALYWNHSRDRFELIRGSEAKVPFNHHRTNVVGLNVNGWFDWLLGRTALGAEFRNEDIVSTNLGEPLDKPFSHYKVGLNRSQLSIHAEHNIMLRQLTLSAGFIAIRNTGNEMDFKVYPGIDASLRLNSHWKLFASYNESLRMPTFTELYYSVGGHKADKYLKPEELRAVEGGVRFEHRAWSVEGKTFYHHCRNIIDWVMDTRDADPIWQSVNLTKVNTLGQELAVNCRLSAVNWQIAYTHLHQHKDEQPHLQSQYSLEYLRHKLAARLNWQLSRHLSTTLCYRYQDRTGSYTSTDGQVKDYRPYSVVDARVAWKMTTTELYAEANNLTSTHYIDYGNVAQPGCWLTVGCKKTLNYK
jgi:iron complex outermembrane receptor protein